MRANILKKQKKIYKYLLSTLSIILIFSNVAYADKTRKRASSKKASRTNAPRVSKVKSATTKTPIETKNTNTVAQSKTEDNNVSKDTTGINRYNCESSYFKCMNNYCFQSQDGRCGCKDTSKFTSSNSQCSYILDVCPSKSKDIVDNYKKGISSDCSGYAMKTGIDRNISVSNALASLTECMKPKCIANRTYEFLGCFDKDNFEKKFAMCKNAYKNTKDISLLENMFKESILSYKQKYCDEIFGTVESDGECHLKIGFGPSYKDIKKVKDFKVGDSVICSESGFNTSIGESKYQKIRLVKDIVLFGIDVAKTGVSIASQIVGHAAMKQELQPGIQENRDNADKLKSAASKYSNDEDLANKLTEQAQVYDAKANALEAVADTSIAGGAVLDGIQGTLGSAHLAGAVNSILTLKDKDFSYKGYCYVIKDNVSKELFEANDDYYYKIRWTPQWSDIILSTDGSEG